MLQTLQAQPHTRENRSSDKLLGGGVLTFANQFKVDRPAGRL
jgi:hypothetical protein